MVLARDDRSLMADPAASILASAIWNAHQSRPDANHDVERMTTPASKRLKTGLMQLDSELQGGFDLQCVTNLTGEPVTGLDDVLTSILAQHLLSSAHASITAITAISATTINLPKLYQRLSTGLIEHRRTQEAAQAEAMSILDRMKIIKVIDLVGLADGLAEMRKDIERERSIAAEKAVIPRFKSTISDSEEDEDDLLVSSRPQSAHQSIEASEYTPKQHLLVIDGFSELMSPPIAGDNASDKALLTSTLRSIRQMTRELSFYTILITGTKMAPDADGGASPSIFSSCTAVPKLGNELRRFADLQILAHMVPISVEDAQILHATQSASRHGGVKLATVIEVLMDKRGKRAEKWLALGSDAEGKLKAL